MQQAQDLLRLESEQRDTTLSINDMPTPRRKRAVDPTLRPPLTKTNTIVDDIDSDPLEETASADTGDAYAVSPEPRRKSPVNKHSASMPMIHEPAMRSPPIGRKSIPRVAPSPLSKELDNVRRFAEDFSDPRHDEEPANLQLVSFALAVPSSPTQDEVMDGRRRYAEDWNDPEHDTEPANIQPLPVAVIPTIVIDDGDELDGRRRYAEDWNDPEHDTEPYNLQPLVQAPSTPVVIRDDDDEMDGQRRYAEDWNDPEHDVVPANLQPIALSTKTPEVVVDDNYDEPECRRYAEDWDDPEHDVEPKDLQPREFCTRTPTLDAVPDLRNVVSRSPAFYDDESPASPRPSDN